MEGSTKCSKCGKWTNNKHMMPVSIYRPISWAHTFYEICRPCYAEYSKIVVDFVEGE